MAVKINDLANLIKEQIKSSDTGVSVSEQGKIIAVADGIAKVSGLKNAFLSELVKFDDGEYGIILSLESDVSAVAILSNSTTIKEGSIVTRTKSKLSTKVGNELLGRVVNAIGQPIDGLGDIKTNKTSIVEKIAPGVMDRASIDEPLQTGILAIDSLIPIGKGQRELIIGDRQTGKTSIALDAILNQNGKDVYCVYVAIGQKNSSVVQVYEKLKETQAIKYTTIVSSTASDLSSLQYIAPYTGITIAEEWMHQGKDVLIVYDDLSKHAVAYRTISLLLRRPPGREAYPGDVFYLHSRLLERAGKLKKSLGGGSITALPIIETQAGDISAYIPTNVISITDGQLFMQTSLFNAGQRPAIDVGFSVSRVGGAAQIKPMKQASASLKLDLASYLELESFSQFGSDLDETTKEIIDHGKRTMEILKQHKNNTYDQYDEVLFLLAVSSRSIKWLPINQVRSIKTEIKNYFTGFGLEIKRELIRTKNLTTDLKSRIIENILVCVKKICNEIPDYNFKDYSKKEMEYNKVIFENYSNWIKENKSKVIEK